MKESLWGCTRLVLKTCSWNCCQSCCFFLPHVVFCEQVGYKLSFRLNLQNTAVWLGWNSRDELTDGPTAEPRGNSLDSTTSSCAAVSFTFNTGEIFYLSFSLLNSSVFKPSSTTLSGAWFGSVSFSCFKKTQNAKRCRSWIIKSWIEEPRNANQKEVVWE